MNTDDLRCFIYINKVCCYKKKRLTQRVNLFFLLSHEDSNLDRQNQNL